MSCPGLCRRSRQGRHSAVFIEMAGTSPDMTIRSVNLSESALMSLSKAGRTKHHQGFDRPASFAEITVDLEIDVQRMRLDFCKSGFDAANRAWVSRLECQFCILDAHVLSPLRDASARLRTREEICSNVATNVVFQRPRWSGCLAPNLCRTADINCIKVLNSLDCPKVNTSAGCPQLRSNNTRPQVKH
jgi:hypothetical protein